MNEINVLITVNAATLVTIIVIGVKITRFLSRIEFKTDLMWKDYESRIEDTREAHSNFFNED